MEFAPATASAKILEYASVVRGGRGPLVVCRRALSRVVIMVCVWKILPVLVILGLREKIALRGLVPMIALTTESAVRRLLVTLHVIVLIVLLALIVPSNCVPTTATVMEVVLRENVIVVKDGLVMIALLNHVVTVLVMVLVTLKLVTVFVIRVGPEDYVTWPLVLVGL